MGTPFVCLPGPPLKGGPHLFVTSLRSRSQLGTVTFGYRLKSRSGIGLQPDEGSSNVVGVAHHLVSTMSTFLSMLLNGTLAK